MNAYKMPKPRSCAVGQLGSERLPFGTALPWFSTFQAIGCILDAEMTDDRRNIFYRNGRKLLGLQTGAGGL